MADIKHYTRFYWVICVTFVVFLNWIMCSFSPRYYFFVSWQGHSLWQSQLQKIFLKVLLRIDARLHCWMLWKSSSTWGKNGGKKIDILWWSKVRDRWMVQIAVWTSRLCLDTHNVDLGDFISDHSLKTPLEEFQETQLCTFQCHFSYVKLV